MDRVALHRRSFAREVRPRFLVALEQPLIGGRKGVWSCLDRVTGVGFVARVERGESSLAHQAGLLELCDLLDVDRAPAAARSPRREADDVALVIARGPDAVDPPV